MLKSWHCIGFSISNRTAGDLLITARYLLITARYLLITAGHLILQWQQLQTKRELHFTAGVIRHLHRRRYHWLLAQTENPVCVCPSKNSCLTPFVDIAISQSLCLHISSLIALYRREKTHLTEHISMKSLFYYQTRRSLEEIHHFQ